MKFLGYARDSGLIGVRNHLLILSAVVCANHAAEKIAEKVRGAVAFCHSNGCGQLSEDLEQTHRTLLGAGLNPNTAAVLVVSMGCESLPSAKLFDEIRSTKKPVGFVNIQVSGGTERAVEEGSTIALELARRIKEDRNEAAVLSLCPEQANLSGLSIFCVSGLRPKRSHVG